MIAQLSQLEENRLVLLSQTEYLTAEQYNFIPAGFNNNIIWNLGHILFIGDSILHNRLHIPDYLLLLAKYGKGSKPNELTNLSEIVHIRRSLTESISIYKTTIQNQSEGFESAIGKAMQAISVEALQFLFFHEQMHYTKVAKLLQKVRIKKLTDNNI